MPGVLRERGHGGGKRAEHEQEVVHFLQGQGGGGGYGLGRRLALGMGVVVVRGDGHPIQSNPIRPIQWGLQGSILSLHRKINLHKRWGNGGERGNKMNRGWGVHG